MASNSIVIGVETFLDSIEVSTAFDSLHPERHIRDVLIETANRLLRGYGLEEIKEDGSPAAPTLNNGDTK